MEYRWGLITWSPRKDRARDAGLLLHCQGEPGNNSPEFRSPWMRSVEYQVIEGGTGDIIGHAHTSELAAGKPRNRDLRERFGRQCRQVRGVLRLTIPRGNRQNANAMRRQL